MVSYKDILSSNAQISHSADLQVAVIVGGTSGIGKFTLKALISSGAKLRVYLVGRKTAREQTLAFIEELSAINAAAELFWIEGDVSLLAETRRVCEDIKSKESRIDLLFLTPGYAPFGPRKETAEGIEIAGSLEYYTRVVFIRHLLPLLNTATTPRVVSVLGGGLEKRTFDVDDIDLRKPGNFGGVKAQGQYLVMNSLTLERLAKANPQVTFVHSWPSIVNTGNVRRSFVPNSVMGWVVWLVLEPILGLLSYSNEESGQRHLFQSTSAAFGGRGTAWKGTPGVNSEQEEANGLFLVNHKCDCTPNADVMPVLRKEAQEKVWNHTEEVIRPYV